MKTVKIINGTYGARDGKTGRVKPVLLGNTVDVSDEEAARLVALRVGVVVEDALTDDAAGAVATPAGSVDGAGAGVDTHDQSKPAEGEETAHLDPEQLKELTNAKLKELAEDMGIDTAKLKTKAQLIVAITDIPLEDAISGGVDGEETPPDLGAEGPVT